MRKSLQGILALVLPTALFTGCAQTRLSEVNRAQYGRVAFAPVTVSAKNYSYNDATMAGTRGGGVLFGIVGALVANGIAAGEEKSGRSHVAGVVEHSQLNVSQVVEQHFATALAKTRRFTLDSSSPQATFYLTVADWGFASGGAGKLAASLWVNAELHTPDGRNLWKKAAMTTSHISGSAKDFQADPTLFRRSFEDAAATVANQLISEPTPSTSSSSSSGEESQLQSL